MNRPLARGILAALTVLAATAAGAEPRYPVGSRVGLEVPPGLTPSMTMPGFEDADRKVAITIVDLPGAAYPQIERGVFATQSQAGVSEEKREMFAFRSGVGLLVSFRLTSEGASYRKWVLLATSAGTPADLTAVVSVQVPDAARDAYPDEVVRAALASVTFRAAPIAEQLAQLPFKLDELAGFRVVRAMPAGGVILTDGPRDDSIEQSNIVISIAPGGPTEASDRARFAEQMLSATPIPDLRLTGSEAMRIGGSPGYEVRAEGKDGRGGTLSVVQWLRFGSGGFLRILAVAKKTEWDSAYPRFRAVRDGIEAR